MRKCPFCAEEIEDDAKICKWCHTDLTAPASPGPASELQTSGMAVASFILGLLFFVFPAAILAVVFGHLSRSAIQKSAGRLKGSGLALTGLILGYLGVSVLPVLIIAAIAIPNLLRARIAANEASAVGSLRTLNVAVVAYTSAYGHYPATLTALGPPPGGSRNENGADLIDSVLGAGTKSGYTFAYQRVDRGAIGAGGGYVIHADPVQQGTTGERHFFTDQSGVIRVETGRPANAHSPPIR